MKKDILLTVGLSQTKIAENTYQVSYCYQVMDMQSGEIFQSAPAIAKDKGYLKIKLSILIDVLSQYGPKLKNNKKQTYIHYAASDDDLKEKWHNEIFDGKKYNKKFKGDNELQWRKVIQLCQENKIILNISGRNSVLSALSKAQGNMLRRQLEDKGVLKHE